MRVATLRKKVHQYLDDADEKVLEVVYQMMKRYSAESIESNLTDEQKEELERRTELYLQGKIKTVPWEDVKKRARKAAVRLSN